MEHSDIIYLDSAATSYPKPPSVINEIKSCMLYSGGNAGRGSHRLAMAASEKIFECREVLSSFFGCPSPDRVVFTLNTTYALNTAIKGLLHEGDRVLISNLEHNAVYRPVCSIARTAGVKYDIFDTCTSSAVDKSRADGELLRDVERKIRHNTKMLVCVSTSNICSRSLPLERIGELCRKRGLIFVVDAAQGAGHQEINMQRMKIDVLCVPSHKGLYGPQGCGAVLLGERISPLSLKPLTEGGNGYDSLGEDMGEALPERLEAGTLPAPLIAGLCEGVKYVRSVGVDMIAEHERKLFLRTVDLLSGIPSVRVYLPEYAGGVLLFNIGNLASDKVATQLDKCGICVRGGYHCTALGHKTLGTQSCGGAVRVSFGLCNKLSDIDKLARAVRSECCI